MGAPRAVRLVAGPPEPGPGVIPAPGHLSVIGRETGHGRAC